MKAGMMPIALTSIYVHGPGCYLAHNRYSANIGVDDYMSGRSGKESKYEEIQAKKVMCFFFLQNLK